MLNSLIRKFNGYLRIRISGNGAERFINACSHKGINLWDLTSKNSLYEMNITIKDFKKLKPVIRKTRTKVTILKRTGFPFFIQKYKQRRLFLIGFFLCIFLIYILSTYIWDINISGNQTYTTENLITFLNTMNIEKGMKRDKVDCDEITRKIRQNYNNVIWVSASLEGTYLNIEIKENEDSRDITNVQDTDVPFDIIADKDCTIEKVIIRNGITQVQKGDYVKKGDLLVSGQIPVYNDAKDIINYQYCISDADISGVTKISYKDQVKKQATTKKYENIQKHEYFVRIGKYKLTLGSIKNNYEAFEEYSKQKDVNGLIIGTRSVFPYKTITKIYTDTQINEILSSNFHYYCQELKKKGVVILKNNVKIYTWSDKANAQGTLTIEMPLGQRVKSEIIEIGDQIDGNDGNNN